MTCAPTTLHGRLSLPESELAHSRNLGSPLMSLAAIRGATSVDADTREQVMARTAELVRAILDENCVAAEEIVSMFFTATPDLTAEFPALAVRQMGITSVPMLCAQEIAVPGALPRCIRVLVHIDSDRGRHDVKHVYLHAAQALRPDLAS
jgi:chorismate mutase